MIKRFVDRMVDVGGKYPVVVLGIVVALMASAWMYASKLQLRSDFLELLPRDSPGFQAFEHQLGRVGGGASLIVVVESPDRASNEKMIDTLGDKLEAERVADKEAGRPERIAYLERGTKDVRQFYRDHRWLYADLDDLKNAYDTLDHQIALKSGAVVDIEKDDDEPASVDAGPPVKATKVGVVAVPGDGGAAAAETPPVASADAGPPDPNAKQEELGLGGYRERWETQAQKHDDFPTGYFATPDGTMMAIRIVSGSTGMGDAMGDSLLARVGRLVEQTNPKTVHPEMKVGFAGDIPNAVAEKESLLSEAALATGAAMVLILGGIAFFYRSMWAVPLVAIPPLFGVGCAYAFATWRYGFVNSSGAFLGAIILGNGINYPIVLYSRYREFIARGMDRDLARREAVWNAFRAELVGASVASIAYGSLTITRFRGFSQFGVIGFVGMILVWVCMIPTVPASIVLFERFQSKLPVWLRQAPPVLKDDESRGVVSSFFGNVTAKYPKFFVGFALVMAVVAAVKLPHFLADPWEYNFHKLGSRNSHHGGAGEWSNKAEKVFGGKMNIAGALMLADAPQQVPLVKAKILANDAADEKGKLISNVVTAFDLLPGTPEEQKAKLEVLERIRDRLTERVLFELSESERKNVEELRPPEDLDVVGVDALPALLKRRFMERSGVVGTVFYVQYRDISLSDGHNLLRIAKTTDNVELPDGTKVLTASRSTVFAEMIRSMERDGPLATAASFIAVALVVVLATANLRGTIAVLGALILGIVWMLGAAAWTDDKLNFLNFIALPITFGIGSEYPFNIYDRSRLLGGDVTRAVKLHLGAVFLCSYTTIVGYGSLVLADNQALQSFGRLAAIGEIACLYGALFFLPSLLHLMERWGGKGKSFAKHEPGET